VLPVAGCGSANRGTGNTGRSLTIYASLPMGGPWRDSSLAILRGAKLALTQIGSKLGRYRITLKELDDTIAPAAKWDPGQTSANAHQAAGDPTTIGYIGELNSAASAISLPILNQAEIPEISPANGAVGLTTSAPGTSPGEPAKYYPTGKRTYARVVPSDKVQAVAQARLQKTEGCKHTAVLDDQNGFGAPLTALFELAARRLGLTVDLQRFDAEAADFSSLARAIAATAADCVFIRAQSEDNAVALTKQIAASLPAARFFAPDGLATSAYTDPGRGGIPSALDSRISITAPVPGLPGNGPAARAFLGRYEASYGSPPPYAVDGYEAMRLLLSALTTATRSGRLPVDRAKVVAAMFGKQRASALGSYSIDGNGDTTLTVFGAYRVVRGQLRFWKAIHQ
jgi:branched-chain amino acid transport system substrate-binding protein